MLVLEKTFIDDWGRQRYTCAVHGDQGPGILILGVAGSRFRGFCIQCISDALMNCGAAFVDVDDPANSPTSPPNE